MLKGTADVSNCDAKALKSDGMAVNGDGKALNGNRKPVKGNEEALNCPEKVLKGDGKKCRPSEKHWRAMRSVKGATETLKCDRRAKEQYSTPPYVTKKAVVGFLA